MHFDPLSQSVVNNDFEFQQSLAVHQGSVRCLAVLPDIDSLVSGSIDKSVKIFLIDKSNGRYAFEKEFAYHDAFIYAVHAK
jgi:WD40 repeat protein